MSCCLFSTVSSDVIVVIRRVFVFSCPECTVKCWVKGSDFVAQRALLTFDVSALFPVTGIQIYIRYFCNVGHRQDKKGQDRQR